MALFPGDMNIGWGFGLYPENEEKGMFDLEEKEGVLTRINPGNRTITLDTSWLFHCSPSLFTFALRFEIGTTLLVEYRMDAMGQRRVKNIVLRKEIEG